MLAPCSANVRATSSSRRGRSQESTASCTRKLFAAVAPSHSTAVKRSGLRRSAFTFGQSSLWVVLPLPRDVADDRVAGNGRAALRETDQDVAGHAGDDH